MKRDDIWPLQTYDIFTTTDGMYDMNNVSWKITEGFREAVFLYMTGMETTKSSVIALTRE